ncbi:TPA: flagellar protein FliT [Enterobacter ludwigii]|jgi:hypothetical protein|nr:flagellar protein FliT [Enterobacter ludwigii]
MDNAVLSLIEQMLVSNATLLRQAEDGEWDAFVEESAAYSIGMRTLCEIDLTQLAQHNKQQVVGQLGQLLDVDARLSRAIQDRLSTLGTELSAMRKSSASAKAYTAV